MSKRVVGGTANRAYSPSLHLLLLQSTNESQDTKTYHIYSFTNPKPRAQHTPDCICSKLDRNGAHNQDLLWGLLHPRCPPISGLDHQSARAPHAPQMGCSRATWSRASLWATSRFLHWHVNWVSTYAKNRTRLVTKAFGQKINMTSKHFFMDQLC
jgi:hypothetical protein